MMPSHLVNYTKVAILANLEKKVCDFPVPSRDVTNRLSWLDSEIPAGDGKIANLFYSVLRIVTI